MIEAISTILEAHSTVIAALIVGGVSVYVAVVPYRGQKEQDREFQIHEEKREAFKLYFGSLETMINSAFTEKPAEQRLSMVQCKNSLNLLSLLASNLATEKCVELYSQSLTLANTLAAIPPDERMNRISEFSTNHDTVDKLFNEAVNFARKDMGLGQLSEGLVGVTILARN